MSQATFEIGTVLDVGRKRQGKPNQDNLKVVMPGLFNRKPPLLVLADGMGGYRGGEEAAALVIRTMVSVYQRAVGWADPLVVLVKGIQRSHQAIKKASARQSELARMGSTVVAAVLAESTLYIANVGDSRAYVINEEGIRLVSHDHSFVAEQVRQGLLTAQEAHDHPKKNVLSMSLTARREKVEPFTAEIALQPDDVVLLCSDGLWGPVPEALIQTAALELRPQQAAEKLAALANGNLGPDNISVIVACAAERKYPDRQDD